MFCFIHTWSKRSTALVSAAAFAALAVGGAAASAQSTISAAPPAQTDLSCAVSTSRIAGLDVTEFFGMSGDAASFGTRFGADSGPTLSSGPTQSQAQRCIRLEVENPSPGDLVPVGGYVLGGFVFDPTAAAGQGSGISAVQVFLDDPNQGGAVIGSVGPGSGTGFGSSSARAASFGDQFANSGFRVTVQIPQSGAGNPHALVIVAQSSAGRIGSVAVPVVVGNLTPAVATRTP